MRATILALAGAMLATPVHAAAQAPAAAVVHLAASATRAVQPDTFTADLSAQATGSDVGTLNNQVSSRIAVALHQAESVAGVVASTTSFSTQPRYTHDGSGVAWTGWTVQAGLHLRASSAKALSLALRALGSSLHIDAVQAQVSAARQDQVDGSLRDAAIARFRAKAAQVAKDFGASGYVVRDVTISDADTHPLPRPIFLRAMAAAPAMQAAPVQPAAQDLRVDVSGSVALLR